MKDLIHAGVERSALRAALAAFPTRHSRPADDSTASALAAIDRRLAARGAMLRAEVSDICADYLRSDAGSTQATTYDTVLVDDAMDFSAATIAVCEALADRRLIITGDTAAHVSHQDPGADASVFDAFQTTHADTTVIAAEGVDHPRPAIAAIGAALVPAIRGKGPLPADEVEGGRDDIRQVKWTDQHDEIEHMTRLISQLTHGSDGMDPFDIAVISADERWARRFAERLKRRRIDSCVRVGPGVLPGDPRDASRCGDQMAYTLLTLLADPDDATGWRCWCAFGHRDCAAAAWAALERYAEERGVSVVGALDGLPTEGDGPFPDAAQLAARYADGRRALDKASGKGFVLAKNLLKHAGDAFDALIQPLSGDETAADLYARAHAAALQPRFDDVRTHVRIGDWRSIAALDPQVLIVGSCIDGLMPGAGCFDERLPENRRSAMMNADRRDFYRCIVKARDRLLIGTVQKMEASEAESLQKAPRHPLVRRVRNDHGTMVANLAPSTFIGEASDTVPGAISGQQFAAEYLS